MKYVVLIGILLLLYIVWQAIELRRFKVTEYEVRSLKVSRACTAVLVSDLHGFCYGAHNERLLDRIRRVSPDMVLIPGDMIVSRKEKTYGAALELLGELKKLAPVYYAYGNHEHRAAYAASPYHKKYAAYEKEAEKLGIRILHNTTEKFSDEIEITGLEIPLSCYKKGKSVPLPKNFLVKNLAKPEMSDKKEAAGHTYSILLAHNPFYAPEYAAWGADLTVCGHNHGGLIRIPKVGSLISPQFKLFPKYDAGEYVLDGCRVIVSRGLGTHTFHIRIFNRAELSVIRIKPQDIAIKP